MLAHLADVAVRSLLLAALAAVVLWMLRRTRTAALQHAIWTSVVCGMLALFAFGQALPRLPLRLLERLAVAPAAPATGLAGATLPDDVSGGRTARIPPTARRSIDWNHIAVYAYGDIASGFLARLLTGMWLVRRLLAGAQPAVESAYESDRLTVPVTVGWLPPRIVLPLEWREWDREKLDAVLAHEGAHARRHDSLIAAMAGVNRCVFWFHPLAWILERKLALLAEQACDEYSVALLGNRERYAGLLLEMARVVDGSQGRLRRHALTMAAPSHIRQRIDSLLLEGRLFSRGLSRMGWAALLLCAIPLVWGAGTLELDHQAQQPQAAQAAAPSPKFEVASIKPCDNNSVAAGRGAGRNGGRGTGVSQGRFKVTCMTVQDLIEISVDNSNNRLTNDSAMPFADSRVRGGPSWIRSDQYSIEAESNDPRANEPTKGNMPAARIMRGPMLQTLLEERFHLKTHREIEEVPMYALTVAKSGLKLKPMPEGGCDPNGQPEWLPGGKPLCRWVGWGVNGPNRTLLGGGVPLSRLAELLGDLIMDRHVLDRTGLATIFNFRVEYAPDETTPLKMIGPREPVDTTSDIPLGVSIFTALEQELGLRLESVKGPHGYIVVDHIERPSEN